MWKIAQDLKSGPPAALDAITNTASGMPRLYTRLEKVEPFVQSMLWVYVYVHVCI